MGTEANQDNILKELLQEIESNRVGENWKLHRDYILAIVNIPIETYLCYHYRYYVENSSAEHILEYFSPANTNYLVNFLIWAGFLHTEGSFFKAGYYLSPSRSIDWLEFFQSNTLSYFQNHIINRELLETAVTGCLHFQDAAEFYCLDTFSEDQMISSAQENFFRYYSILSHPLSRKILKEAILLRKKGMSCSLDSLYEFFYQRLHEKSIEWNLLKEKGGQHDSSTSKENEKIQNALKIMGMDIDTLPQQEELRKKYCILLKEYHPDIKKNQSFQEETAREIIHSYNILFSACRKDHSSYSK